MKSFACRVVVPAVVAAMGLVPGTASAATTANALATTAATSGTWSATLHNAAGVASTGQPVTMSWLTWSPPVYLSVRNSGALPLTGQTYTLTRTGFTTSYTATACLGGYWNGGGNCTGETLTLDSTTTTTATSADLPLAPGESASIKVTATRAGTATVTLSVSVARTQARPAATTSS
jgi:hypothetical protein